MVGWGSGGSRTSNAGMSHTDAFAGYISLTVRTHVACGLCARVFVVCVCVSVRDTVDRER